MTDYTENTYSSAPWYGYQNDIRHIIIDDGINHIGSFSFCFEDNLEDVILPASLKSIGTAAFAGNDRLLELTLPNSIKEIGEYAFGYNRQMKLTDGFAAVCEFNSFAQQYCIKNYIKFDTPFSESGTDTAVILDSNWQSMWSFVPKTDGMLTFYSTGSQDTFGLIYDADNYAYNTSFNEMKKSALVSGDDQDEDVNFRINCRVSAGKRYYLSAKFRNEHKSSGKFTVHTQFECITHIYEETILIEPTCDTDGTAEYTCSVCGDTYEGRLYALGHNYQLNDFKNGIAKIQCIRCCDEYSIPFIDYVNRYNPIIDVVQDGVINAKDYAYLIKIFAE